MKTTKTAFSNALLLTVIAVALATVIALGHEAIAAGLNGLCLNGHSANGIQVNGVGWNLSASNGTTLNTAGSNGLCLNTAGTNGKTCQGKELIRSGNRNADNTMGLKLNGIILPAK